MGLWISMMTCAGVQSEIKPDATSTSDESVVTVERPYEQMCNSIIIGAVDGLVIGSGAAMLKKYAGFSPLAAYMGSYICFGWTNVSIANQQRARVQVPYHQPLARSVSLLLSALIMNKVDKYL